MLMRFMLKILLGVLLVAAWLSAQASSPSLEENIRAIKAQRSTSRATFDFVVLGDSRDGPEVYAELLRQAEQYKPRFILHTGDLVRNGSFSDYVNYIRLLSVATIPILHVPGNHDIKGGYDNYNHVVGAADWYFDFGPYRFIGLDNAASVFSEETVMYARRSLSTTKHCFVMFHEPPAVEPWTAHSIKPDAEGGRGGEIMRLIGAARCWGVFLGHIHMYDEKTIDGIPYIICGGGGAPLHQKYGFGEPEYGMLVVHVSPEGMTHKWVPLKL